jgi:hypothetical protein
MDSTNGKMPPGAASTSLCSFRRYPENTAPESHNPLRAPRDVGHLPSRPSSTRKIFGVPNPSHRRAGGGLVVRASKTLTPS